MTKVNDIIESLKRDKWQLYHGGMGESIERIDNGGAWRIFFDDWFFVNHDNLNDGGFFKFTDRMRLRWAIRQWRKLEKTTQEKK